MRFQVPLFLSPEHLQISSFSCICDELWSVFHLFLRYFSLLMIVSLFADIHYVILDVYFSIILKILGEKKKVCLFIMTSWLKISLISLNILLSLFDITNILRPVQNTHSSFRVIKMEVRLWEGWPHLT